MTEVFPSSLIRGPRLILSTDNITKSYIIHFILPFELTVTNTIGIYPHRFDNSVLARLGRSSLPLLLPHQLEYARKMPGDPPYSQELRERGKKRARSCYDSPALSGDES